MTVPPLIGHSFTQPELVDPISRNSTVTTAYRLMALPPPLLLFPTLGWFSLPPKLLRTLRSLSNPHSRLILISLSPACRADLCRANRVTSDQSQFAYPSHSVCASVVVTS